VIVLFNPWSTVSSHKPLPMSLLAIGSMLEGEVDYCIVDGNVEADAVARILAVEEKVRITAVAVTVMPGAQLRSAVAGCRQLKRMLPYVPIIWGGYFPSQHAEACLSESTVDICVRGQGEHTFYEVIRALRAGAEVSSIAGLTYRRNGVIHRTAERPLLQLDALPPWPYHKLPMERYFHASHLGARVAAHQSSFGCPFACNFCAVVGMSNRKWVAQSPERVAEVLEKFRKIYGADAVQFHDMDFFVAEARTLEIADRATGLGLAWSAPGRVDELMHYRDTTWAAMKRSGLKTIACGAESGSTDTLQRMNKGGTATAELTIALAARAKSYGVIPEFSFVVGNPPDPHADLAHTLSLIRRLKQIDERTGISLNVYAPVPLEGALFQGAHDAGFRFPDTLEGWVSDRWQTFALRRDPDAPWSHGDVRRKVRDFESVLHAYYASADGPPLTPAQRRVLRAASAWRYHAKAYARPLELNFLLRAFRHQRPEGLRQ
jgi:anaerobic magnesium-protoporphyrin IX monomethyl ester cyclase